MRKNLDFERVVTEAGDVWFPTHWIKEPHGGTWKVDQLKINVTLPAELFKPAQIQGVTVVPLEDPAVKLGRLMKKARENPGVPVSSAPEPIETDLPRSQFTDSKKAQEQTLPVQQEAGEPRLESTAHLWVFVIGILSLIWATLAVFRR